MERTVHVLVLEGMADWEPAFALAELGRSGYRVVTVGFESGEITTMGGLRIAVDELLWDLRPDATRLLILPGSDAWEKRDYPVERFEAKIRELVIEGMPVAAICGAVVGLARAGIFADRAHTSADAEWLASVVPGYAGEELHRQGLAFRDGNVITASPVGAVDFAREILSFLEVMPEERLSVWYHLYKFGCFPAGVEPRGFFDV